MKNRTTELIFGKTGTGKSTLARMLIKNYDRVIIIDPMHEYEGIIFYDYYTLNEYHRHNKLENFVYVCRFSDDLDIEYLFKFCKVIGNILLVLEECSMYVSPQSKSNEFLNIIRFGRHYNISLLGISRRTTELHNDLKAIIDTIYSFKQVLPNDLLKMQRLDFENLESLISLSDVPFREPQENIHYKKINY
jgi:hypothetical protein